jgi:hypothetical protein
MARRILTALIVLAFLSGLCILSYHAVGRRFDKKESMNSVRRLSDNVETVKYADGSMSVLNSSTGKIIGRYDKIFHCHETGDTPRMTRVTVKNGLRGYISAATGEPIYEPQFLRAWVDDPETDLAACVNTEGKLGFVDVRTRQVAIPFEFDCDENDFFRCDNPSGEEVASFDFVFSNGVCIVPGKEGKIGMIDKSGQLLLPVEFTDIINWRDKDTPHIILKKRADDSFLYGVCDRSFNMIIPFEYNLFIKNTDYDSDGNIFARSYIVEKDGKYGLLDSLFNLVLPCEFDWIMSNFPDRNIIARKDYVQKLYNNRGEVIMDFYLENDYETVDVFETVYSEGRLTSYIRYYLDGYYGIIDNSRRVVIPAKYHSVKYLGNGNFVCSDNDYSFIIKDKYF